MSAIFDKCFKIVVGEEGGYVNNPKDPGGETKFGVTKKSYPHLDIKNLTIEKAKEIYKKNYWDQCHGDDLPFIMALPVFDASINCGVGGANAILTNMAKANKLDGSWVVTKAFINNHPEQALVDFMAQQVLYKVKLKIFATFGLGWMRRAFRITIHAIRG